ncbi:hypothetical protein [Actinoallomurus acaciae]|uniref:Uncharacterized protein n=1 Tax=Actinoallomurus acaciae TaxID=502577 RepID=A0ABV5YPU2_9ACTN
MVHSGVPAAPYDVVVGVLSVVVLVQATVFAGRSTRLTGAGRVEPRLVSGPASRRNR